MVAQSLRVVNTIVHQIVYKEQLVTWKLLNLPPAQTLHKSEDKLGLVLYTYLKNLISRNKDVLVKGKGRRFKLGRSNWTQFCFFTGMYYKIEDVMVDCGVAQRF